MAQSTLGIEEQLVEIGTAVAKVLDELNAVTERQRQSILALAVDASTAAHSQERKAAAAERQASPPPAVAAAELAPVSAQPQAQGEQRSLEQAEAHALALVYEAAAQAISLAFQNAVQAQQQLNTIAQAATTEGVALIYAETTAAEAQRPPSGGLANTGT